MLFYQTEQNEYPKLNEQKGLSFNACIHLLSYLIVTIL